MRKNKKVIKVFTQEERDAIAALEHQIETQCTGWSEADKVAFIQASTHTKTVRKAVIHKVKLEKYAVRAMTAQ